MKRVAFVIVLLLGIAEFSFFSPISFSQSQPLQTYTGTGCFTYQTKGLGLDLPKITYCLSPTKFSYADSLNNFTVNIPKLSGVALTITTLKNSTALEAQLTGTVSGHPVNLNFLWVQQKFNALVLIQGTITGLVGTLPLTMTLPGAVQAVSTDTFVSQGHLSFDWSADAASAAYVSSTQTLTFNIGASVNIDPLALDNTVQKTCASAASCTSGSIIFGLNSVIIFGCAAFQSSDTFSASSSPSLTWTKRKVVTQTGNNLDEFWAVSSASQSYTLTCTTSGANIAMGIRGFGISGADPTPTFDPNGAVPCTATGTTGTTQSCNISTSNSNDFIFGLMDAVGILASTAAISGFTLIGAVANPVADYDIVSATQTNLAVGFTSAANQPTWNLIGDAVEANNCCTSTTSTTTSTTTTITNNLGDAPNFLWLLLLVFVPVFFVLLRKRL